MQRSKWTAVNVKLETKVRLRTWRYGETYSSKVRRYMVRALAAPTLFCLFLFFLFILFFFFSFQFTSSFKGYFQSNRSFANIWREHLTRTFDDEALFVVLCLVSTTWSMLTHKKGVPKIDVLILSPVWNSTSLNQTSDLKSPDVFP